MEFAKESLEWIKNKSNDTESVNVSAPIVEALEKYYENPCLQMHIPGHTKGVGILPRFKELINKNVAYFDMTDDFDGLGTLHPQSGLISEAQKLAAEAFGAQKSFFLLNGSTIGNLALALTSTKVGQKVIVGRNCHRSVITGLILSGAEPLWVTPQKLQDWSLWGAVNPKDIRNYLEENSDVGLVWITSPTYEGIVSNIKEISEICKEYNVPLFVDEAHGCLWNFNDKLPQSALELGADAVVHSMHKTGGSFTQSSILHISKDSKINIDRVEDNLRLLHTTSPSVLLLASIDAARAYLSSMEGKSLIDKSIDNASYLRQELSSIPDVKIIDNSARTECICIDPTKIYMMIEGLSGKRLENILEVEYKIEVEASTDNGILVLSNIGNSRKDIEYFCDCIKSIVKSKYSDISYLEDTKYMPLLKPEIVMSPREAFYKDREKVSPINAIGKISVDLIAECPPGIFVLAPGELVTENHLPYLKNYSFINVIK